MKLVIAVIKQFKLEEVQDALTKLGVYRYTVTECKRFGPQRGHTVIHRGSEFAVTFVPMVTVAITVQASFVDKIVDTIVKSARTGDSTDGEIIVTDIERTTHIGTGMTEV
ncbi:MAG TPA: P-II family nitrogen regulator [Methylocella sp.]|nr:P-II family nitrogen regulator [Methylocella sp.]